MTIQQKTSKNHHQTPKHKGKTNMANHKQAKKRIRQTEKRTELNKARHNRVRTFTRKFEDALQSKNADDIKTALSNVMSEIHRAATRGIFHKNNAARKISRLNKQALNATKT